jgi:hypothetical protein
MAEESMRYKVLHFLIRILSAVSMAGLGIAILAPEYEPSRLLHLQGVIWKWYLLSSLALPLSVGLGASWMRTATSQAKALLVDWVFALMWFFMWWFALLYTFYRHGFPWL